MKKRFVALFLAVLMGFGAVSPTFAGERSPGRAEINGKPPAKLSSFADVQNVEKEGAKPKMSGARVRVNIEMKGIGEAPFAFHPIFGADQGRVHLHNQYDGAEEGANFSLENPSVNFADPVSLESLDQLDLSFEGEKLEGRLVQIEKSRTYDETENLIQIDLTLQQVRNTAVKVEIIDEYGQPAREPRIAGTNGKIKIKGFEEAIQIPTDGRVKQVLEVSKDRVEDLNKGLDFEITGLEKGFLVNRSAFYLYKPEIGEPDPEGIDPTIITFTEKIMATMEDKSGDKDYVKVSFSGGNYGALANNKPWYIFKDIEMKRPITPAKVNSSPSWEFIGWDPQLQYKYDRETTHIAQYKYRDKLILPEDSNNPGTLKDGYVRLVFDAGADGKIGERQKKVLDVRSDVRWEDPDLQSELPTMAGHQDKGKEFEKWQPALPKKGTVNGGTYIAVYKDRIKPSRGIESLEQTYDEAEDRQEIIGKMQGVNPENPVSEGSIVKLLDQAKNELAETHPDGDGKFSFPVSGLEDGQKLSAVVTEEGKDPGPLSEPICLDLEGPKLEESAFKLERDAFGYQGKVSARAEDGSGILKIREDLGGVDLYYDKEARLEKAGPQEALMTLENRDEIRLTTYDQYGNKTTFTKKLEKIPQALQIQLERPLAGDDFLIVKAARGTRLKIQVLNPDGFVLQEEEVTAKGDFQEVRLGKARLAEGQRIKISGELEEKIGSLYSKVGGQLQELQDQRPRRSPENSALGFGQTKVEVNIKKTGIHGEDFPFAEIFGKETAGLVLENLRDPGKSQEVTFKAGDNSVRFPKPLAMEDIRSGLYGIRLADGMGSSQLVVVESALHWDGSKGESLASLDLYQVVNTDVKLSTKDELGAALSHPDSKKTGGKIKLTAGDFSLEKEIPQDGDILSFIRPTVLNKDAINKGPLNFTLEGREGGVLVDREAGKVYKLEMGTANGNLDPLEISFREKSMLTGEDKSQDPDYAKVHFSPGDRGSLDTWPVYYVFKGVTMGSKLDPPKVTSEEGWVQKEGEEAWKPALAFSYHEDTRHTAQHKKIEENEKAEKPLEKPHRPGRGSKKESRPLGEEESLIKGRHVSYLKGYPDGSFCPDEWITRGESAQIIANLKGLPLTDSSAPRFKDTPSAWYNEAINAVVEAGIMQGCPDGNFKPKEKISRAEFATILQAMDKPNRAKAPFSDIRGHWAQDAICQAYGNGRIKGYPDGTFKPDEKLTRAEVVVICNRLFDRKPDARGLEEKLENPQVLKEFSDLKKSHWAYYEILEAANSHVYQRRFTGGLEEDWIEVQ